MTSRMLYLYATVRPDASVASWAMHCASESNVASGMRISILLGVTIAIKKWPSGASDMDGAAGKRGGVFRPYHPQRLPLAPNQTTQQRYLFPRFPCSIR